MIRTRLITLIVAALLVAAVWGFVRNGLMYDPIAQFSEAEQAAAEQARAREPFENAWGSAIVERDVFSQTRSSSAAQRAATLSAAENEPPPPPVVMEPEAPTVRPHLHGIIIDRKGTYIAYMSFGEDQNIVTVRVGDMMQEYKVVEISEMMAVLDWRGERVELFLHR